MSELSTHVPCTTPRPIDTVVQYCAVHMTVDPFALGRHGDSFGTVDVFVSPPTSQGFAHAALGALDTLPVTVKTASQHIKDFAEGQVPHLVPASTLHVL